MRKLNAMEDFQRDISYRVKVGEDDSITLKGSIADLYHDIEVTIVVDGENLEIRQSRVVFTKGPSPHCQKVEQRMEMLEGTVIGRGLTRKINAALGGCSGCGNLRTLLMGLLPLALNVKACMGIDDEQQMLDAIHHELQGTCAGYPVCDADADGAD